MKRVLKWDVPVDDQSHPIGAGPVSHIAVQGSHDVVQVWTVETDGEHGIGSSERRTVQVFGTGQGMPDDATVLGSALATPLSFVWHVVEVER